MSTTPVPSTQLLKFPDQFSVQDRAKSHVHNPYIFFKISFINPIIQRSYYTVTIWYFTHQVFSVGRQYYTLIIWYSTHQTFLVGR